MNPLARIISGARGSPNTSFGTRNTANMNGQFPSSAPSGPKSFQNGCTRSQYNGNQYNGNQYNGNQYNGNQYNGNQHNGNRSRNNQNYHNNQYSHNHHNQNYNNHGNGDGNGNGNGNVNRNVNPNPNYKGKNFNPNYHGKNFNPNYKGKNFNPNYQRPRGGSVADGRGSPESQLNGQGPFTGARNNHRNRNRNNNKSLPQKFQNMYRDIDIIMTDAPSNEPTDIEMPDAPPLPVDPRIEAFTASAQAVQEIAVTMIKMASDINRNFIPT